MPALSLVVLLDVAPGARLWGWSRIVLGARLLAGVPGLRFAKVLGSGHEAGFGLRPSGSRQGLFCQFEDEASADRFLGSSTMAAYRRHAARALPRQAARLCLARGLVWRAGAGDGRAAGRGHGGRAHAGLDPPGRRLALLGPCARVGGGAERRGRMQARGGLGEAPVFRQATFSLWDSVAAMDAYARGGAHLAAIQAARHGEFFTESMFVRFQPIDPRGVWKGQHFG